MDPPSDQQLVAAFRAGDGAAFDEIVRRHQDAMWHIGFRILRNGADAQDAVQAALVVVFRRAETYRGDSSLISWLRSIVVRTSLEQYRKRGRATVSIDDVDEAGSGGADSDPDLVLDVRSALEELPEDQLAAVFLTVVRGFTVAETAALLGVREGTVKSRAARGRARLALRLGYLRPQRQSSAAGDDKPNEDIR